MFCSCELTLENFEGVFTKPRQGLLEVAYPLPTRDSRARFPVRRCGSPLHRTWLPTEWGVHCVFAVPSPYLPNLSTLKRVVRCSEPRLRSPSLCTRGTLPELDRIAKILVHFSFNLLKSLRIFSHQSSLHPLEISPSPDPPSGCSIERAPAVQIFFGFAHESVQ